MENIEKISKNEIENNFFVKREKTGPPTDIDDLYIKNKIKKHLNINENIISSEEEITNREFLKITGPKKLVKQEILKSSNILNENNENIINIHINECISLGIKITKNGIEEMYKLKAMNFIEKNNLYLEVVNCSNYGLNTDIKKCLVNDLEYKCYFFFIEFGNEKISENDIVKIVNFSFQKDLESFIIYKYEVKGKNNYPKKVENLKCYSENSNLINQQNNVIHDFTINFQSKPQIFESNNSNNNIFETKQLNKNIQIDLNHKENEKNCSNYLPLEKLDITSKEILIKAKIEKKFPIIFYNNGGSVINFIIIDENGFELPCCAFRKATKIFNDLIEESKVYEFKGGKIIKNNTSIGWLKTKVKYEINEKTKILEIKNDNSIKLIIKYTKLDRLKELEINSFINVMGYVLEIFQKEENKIKNEERNLKKIKIIDDTKYTTEICFWGQACGMEIKEKYIYTFKNIQLGKFKNTLYLNVTDFTKIIREENNDKSINLKKIIENYNQLELTLRQIDSNLETGISGDYKVKAKIKSITRKIPYYSACPVSKCNKKIEEVEEVKGKQKKFFCKKCNEMFDNCKYNYQFSLIIKQENYEIFVDVIGDIGNKVLRVSADELKNIYDHDEKMYRIILDDVISKEFYFTIESKELIYQNEKKKKYIVLRIDEVN